MKWNTVKVLVVLISAASLINCRNNSAKSKAVKSPEVSAKLAENKQAAVNLGEVKLLCKDSGTDSLNTRQYNLLLLARGKETKLTTLNACNEIPETEYKIYDIPVEAISACGGSWAGAGDYYYVVLKKDSAVVFSGWHDETQKNKDFHWKQIMTK
jgi:hypothetical protein